MSDPFPDANQASWRFCLSRQALVLVALVTLARLVYVAFFCPYNLVEDEAQYWVWSLRPDWSYYSKGPGIAWSIWLSTKMLGVSEWGVRALAPIYAAIGALAVAGLSADAWRERRAAFAGAALFLIVPVFTLNGTFLMTIDGPMLACWGVACWAGFRALYRASGWAWAALGIALGIGFLFKYTIVLLIPSLAIAAILDRKNLRVIRSWPGWLAISLVCVGAGLVPIAIWNQQNGWPAVAHFLGHAKLPGGDRPASAPVAHYTPKWTLEFLGIQLAGVGPALVLMWLGLRHGLRGGTFGAAAKDDSASRSAAIYLASTGLTTLVFYFVATFMTSVEANWPVGGYVTLCAAAAIAVVRGMDDWKARMTRWRATPPSERPKEGLLLRRPETPAQVAWHLTLGYGILVSLLILRLDVIGRFPEIARHVALHRLMGAPQFAAAIAKLRQEKADAADAERGGTPLLISYHYGVAAQLTFYLPDHPMVYVAGSRLGYRRTQWDLWPDMSLSRPELRGRNALLIGGGERQWAPAFDSVTEIGHLPEDLRRDRWVYFGRGYRGFDGEFDHGPDRRPDRMGGAPNP